MHNDTRLRLEQAAEQACTEVTNAVRKYVQIARALGWQEHDVVNELHEGDVAECCEVWEEAPPPFSVITGNQLDDILNTKGT